MGTGRERHRRRDHPPHLATGRHRHRPRSRTPARPGQKTHRPANAGRPALDENGYPMWDHLIALSNRQCWQWEIAAAHSGCLAAIMQAAGIDDWPPADSMPDITNPVITINLSTNQ